MIMIPHPDQQLIRASCAVLTISDSRTPETDRSGQLIQALLQGAGHLIAAYQILPDEPDQIRQQIQAWTEIKNTRNITGNNPDSHNSEIVVNPDVVICNGGTGIAARDTTYDVLEQLLEKTLPGFGELFRFLSYQEIGSRAVASRAIAGLYHQKLIFSLPGATNAVRLGMEKLILPEIMHLIKQITGLS
ncbi:MAG: MogA/MoaB family molybdenum cofactor biosynthesis protein [Coleofasciculaceae cyanobacterium SM2_1_6]|nr:MogA/MoaB family molybdenum cofactor biosynthesis protein [Coleofasciculaceae cyanobacterium SM2_1_6]